MCSMPMQNCKYPFCLRPRSEQVCMESIRYAEIAALEVMDKGSKYEILFHANDIPTASAISLNFS